MTLAWVRRTYGVPAKRGGRVRYTGEGRDEVGTIIGTSGGHLKVRLDSVKHGLPFHPTWRLEYLPPIAPRVNRLLELIWEADRQPERIELTEPELRLLMGGWALARAQDLYHRGVRVVLGQRSLIVCKMRDGTLYGYPLPDQVGA